MLLLLLLAAEAAIDKPKLLRLAYLKPAASAVVGVGFAYS
jgi:hypothetical protein